MVFPVKSRNFVKSSLVDNSYIQNKSTNVKKKIVQPNSRLIQVNHLFFIGNNSVVTKAPFIKHHILNIDSSTKSSYENVLNSNMLYIYIYQYSVMFLIAWISIQAKTKIKDKE